MDKNVQAAARRIKRKTYRKRHRRKYYVFYSCFLCLGMVLGCLLMGTQRIIKNIFAKDSISSESIQAIETMDEQEVMSPTIEIESTYENLVASSIDSWKLILVNPWNKITEGYEVALTQLKDGEAVDERCYPDLQNMMDDCRAAGLEPIICSSYRSQEKQEKLYNNKVERLMNQEYSLEEARIEAGKSVAVPGTSEHQLGLAVDIVDKAYQNLDENQEKTAVQRWLMENSWKYGFILRYPNEKSNITGIIYEPWHYRYVGKEAAKEIYDQGICLEEYLEQ